MNATAKTLADLKVGDEVAVFIDDQLYRILRVTEVDKEMERFQAGPLYIFSPDGSGYTSRSKRAERATDRHRQELENRNESENARRKEREAAREARRTAWLKARLREIREGDAVAAYTLLREVCQQYQNLE